MLTVSLFTPHGVRCSSVCVVAVISGFVQVSGIVLWVVLHVWVDISGVGFRNIMSPPVVPQWDLPGMSCVELSEGPILTRISHLTRGCELVLGKALLVLLALPAPEKLTPIFQAKQSLGD